MENAQITLEFCFQQSPLDGSQRLVFRSSPAPVLKFKVLILLGRYLKDLRSFSRFLKPNWSSYAETGSEAKT